MVSTFFQQRLLRYSGAMLPVRPHYVTEAEFLQLPESVDKIELIDGEVFVSPAPTPRHQNVQGRLYARLLDWADARPPAVVLAAPTDVRFQADRILQPDVMVFFEAIDLDQSPINRVPTVCIEVLSPTNRSHDLLTKRFVYGAAGVQLYWIVNPSGSAEMWTGPNLTEGAAVIDALESGLLPGFRLALAELFV